MDAKNIVLITSVGATGAQNVIKALRKQKKYQVFIIGCDGSQYNAGAYLCDKFFTVPFATSGNYIPTLYSICENEKVNLLIPIMENELDKISSQLDLFKKFNPIVSSHETILLCNDKIICNKLIDSIDIKIPQTFNVFNSNDLPLIIKPKNGTGSTNIKVFRETSDISLVDINTDNFIIQKYISGKEYTVDCYSSLDNSFIECVPRERIATKGGLSTQTKTVDKRELIDLCQQILKKIKIKGPSNIQFIEDSTGSIYFIEINPRFGGAYIASIEAGLNAPLFLLNEINGDKIEYHGYKKNLLMMRYWQEVYEHNLV